MTAIVGLRCKNGVVVGTDSSATLVAGQIRTIEQPTDKLCVIGGSVVIAGTGQIGLGQRFAGVAQQLWEAGAFQKPPLEISRLLSKAGQEDFASTYTQKGQYGALVAFHSSGTFNLCELDVAQFQPELKTDQLWFCSMGSGQPITDPFLAFMREVFWESGCPNVRDGVFVATWTLDHVVTVNPGGINGPVRIAILEANGNGSPEARILDDEELAEHRQHIREAKGLLKGHRKKLQSASGDGVPNVPRAQ